MKFFTTAIAWLCASASAMAAAPLSEAFSAASSLTPYPSEACVEHLSSTRVAAPAMQPQGESLTLPQAAPAQAPNAAEWEYIGEATYADAFLYIAYGQTKLSRYKVPCYQSKTNPSMYLLYDIYPEEYISERGLYMVENTNDVSKMTIYTRDDGVVAQIDFNLVDKSDNSTIGCMQYKGATMQDGVISFPKEAFAITYDGTMEGYSPAFKVVMPFGLDCLLSLDKTGGLCTDSGKVSFDISAGPDAIGVKVYVVNGVYTIDENAYSTVAAVCDLVEQGHYDVDMEKAGWVTVAAVALNPDGNAADGSYFYHYAPMHNDSEWYSLGFAEFSDDTFTPLYQISQAVPAYNVEVLENVADPGRIRLKNPYRAHVVADQMDKEGKHTGHDHFMTFDITNPSAVDIEMAPMGVSMGGQYEWTIDNEADGTLSDGKITFPKDGLVLCDANLDGYYVNMYGRFAVTVPDHLAVKVTDVAGKPLKGALVKYPGYTGSKTDANGEVHLGVPAGFLENVTVSMDKYETKEVAPVVNGRQLTAIVALADGNGIDAIEGARSEAVMYDLLGRPVTAPAPGIYVVGGKKVIVTK